MTQSLNKPVFSRHHPPAPGTIIDYYFAVKNGTRQIVYDDRGGDPRKAILFETLVDKNGEIGALLVFFTKAVRSLENDKRYLTMPRGEGRTKLAHNCPEINVQVDIGHLLVVPNMACCLEEPTQSIGPGLMRKIREARENLFHGADLHDCRERMSAHGLRDEVHVLSRKGVSPGGWVARGFAHA